MSKITYFDNKIKIKSRFGFRDKQAIYYRVGF